MMELLSNIDKQKVYTTLTFIIPLLKELEDKPDFMDECIQLLKALYVFLVRRSIAGLRKTEDNTTFPRLWEDIKDQTDKVEIMKKKFREKRLFVTDANLQDRFISLNLYGHTQEKFILTEIDKYLCRNNNHKELPDYSTIPTTEHVLPQSFSTEKDWKAYLKNEYEVNPLYDEILSNRVHTIGNLFLVGHSRNSSAQNDIFTEKLNKYSSNSGLSKDLLKNYSDKKWNAEAIETRSKKLAEIAAKIWDWDIK